MKQLLIILIFAWSTQLVFPASLSRLPLYQQKEAPGAKTIQISFKDFEKNAHQYIGRTVEITGIVDHVCKHGGKKMFLVDTKSDGRIKVTIGDDLAAFTQDLIGETVKVKGIVEELRVDEDYINQMESRSDENIKEKGDGLHLEKEPGKHEEHDDHEQNDKVKALRQKLKDSGKDYLSFFSIQAIEYETVQ